VTPTCVTTGIFERVANHHTANNSRHHDITTISEESATASNNGEDGGGSHNKLLNWYERSPRKRSVTVIPTFEVIYILYSKTLESIINKINYNCRKQYILQDEEVFVLEVYCRLMPEQ
jgi:hypothetical protein